MSDSPPNLAWIYTLRNDDGNCRVVEFLLSDDQRLIFMEFEDGSSRETISGDKEEAKDAWEGWVRDTYGCSWYGDEIVYETISEWSW